MKQKRNRYAKLLSNTFILTLGTIGSKALIFFLTPLYTSYLTTGEFGIVDLLVSAANLLDPAGLAGNEQCRAALRHGRPDPARHSAKHRTGR